MTDDDPFFGSGDSDRTILRPTPGGRRGQSQPAAPAPTSPPQQPYPQQQPYAQPAAPQAGGLPDISGGLNPLTAAATTLLALIAQLRDSASHPDPSSLFQHVSQEVQQFEATARAKGEPADVILGARYVLCTSIDETVLNTPWGSQSVWATQTLLGTFHNETWGGEKFFQLLDRLIQEPARNIHLLELMYLCLALGFEGKFRVQDRGRAMLGSLQDNLYQTIRLHRGEIERELSPRWQGVQDRRSKLARYVPLWVVAAVSAGLLLLIYSVFLISINSAASPALAEMASLGRNVQPLGGDRVFVTSPARDLRDYLQDEINADLVAVTDVNRGQVVTIRGDGLFASGSAEVRREIAPLLMAIADALNQVPGQVTVTGHTDNVPIGSLRFPSNWVLSEARADAVRQILASRVSPDRLRAQGVADTQPIAPNDTPANRAMNRRVEILLTEGASRQ
jgi:type VI secretion system protein ImpK